MHRMTISHLGSVTDPTPHDLERQHGIQAERIMAWLRLRFGRLPGREYRWHVPADVVELLLVDLPEAPGTFLRPGQVWDGGPYARPNAGKLRRIVAVEGRLVEWLNMKGSRRRSQVFVFEAWVRDRRAQLLEGERPAGADPAHLSR